MNEPTMRNPLALARKEQILAGMRLAALQRRRRRRAAVVVAAAVPVLAPVLAWAVATAVAQRPSPLSPQRVARSEPAPAPAVAPVPVPAPPPVAALAMAHARFQIAEESTTSHIQIAPPDLTLPVAILDDESLSDELRTAGRDPSVVRTSAGVVVLAATHDGPGTHQ